MVVGVGGIGGMGAGIRGGGRGIMGGIIRGVVIEGA